MLTHACTHSHKCSSGSSVLVHSTRVDSKLPHTWPQPHAYGGEQGKTKTGITTHLCVCVCVSTQVCAHWLYQKDLIEGLFAFIHLCDLELTLSLFLCSVNPSVFLPDSGHDRGHLLPDPPGKGTSCHVRLLSV